MNQNQTETTNVNPSYAKLAEALAKAQSKFVQPKKSKLVDFTHNGVRTKYNYADLADVIEVTKGPLSENGLSVVHQLEFREAAFGVKTTLFHSSGEFISSWYPLPNPGGGKPQAFASMLTYARRYSYSALIGVAAEEDDDGGGATTPPGGSDNKKQDDKKNTESKPDGLIQPPPVSAPAQQTASKRVSEEQVKRLYSIASAMGWKSFDAKAYMKENFKIESAKELEPYQYEKFCDYMEKFPKTKQESQAAAAAPNNEAASLPPPGGAAAALTPPQNTSEASKLMQPKSMRPKDYIIQEAPEFLAEFNGKTLQEISPEDLRAIAKHLEDMLRGKKQLTAQETRYAEIKMKITTHLAMMGA